MIETLQNSLQQTGTEYSVSELHGMMCGVLISDKNFSFSQWLDEITYLDIKKDYLSESIIEMLKDLFAVLSQQLKDGDMQFKLLLPDSNTSYIERVHAISEWCSGFIYGIGVGKIMQTKSLSEQSRSFIEDINELRCGIDVSYSDENELKENEIYYTHFVEYLCMGVLIMLDDIQSQSLTSSN